MKVEQKSDDKSVKVKADKDVKETKSTRITSILGLSKELESTLSTEELTELLM
ncbi:hypothetical protein [Bacillus sp. S10(2024)]|uniref:hypothetical protein n=1 Tax=Bacillus sp. S10(2024) TaxID=3162886 RepID=UPI003D1DE025